MVYICLITINHSVTIMQMWKLLTDLLACTDTSIDLKYEAPSDHLEQNNTCARVEHLLARCAIALVFEVRRRRGALTIYAYAQVVRHVNVA